MLLLDCSRSEAPFWDVFLILVALSLSAVLGLCNITPGGNAARVVGRNTRRKRDKKNLKTILLLQKNNITTAKIIIFQTERLKFSRHEK